MMQKLKKILFVWLSLVAFAAAPCWGADALQFSFRIVQTYPHDPAAFTQGLAYADGSLYEGTGLNGHSSLRKVDLGTGKVLKIHSLPSEYFGEGIDIWGNTIAQLTWRSGRGFLYDKETFQSTGEFRYDSEGWGITHDGRHYIMSDGTACLRFLDPKRFTVVRKLKVTWNGKPVENLNELEYVRAEVFANIWGRDVVVRISPKTGRVTGWIDLGELRNRLGINPWAEALNGIAYVPERDTLLVTGKNWPLLFEIKIEKKQR